MFLSLHAYSRRGADRLHADIVVSLEVIFAYISVETGQIWTKLGIRMANQERMTLQNFWRDCSRGPG